MSAAKVMISTRDFSMSDRSAREWERELVTWSPRYAVEAAVFSCSISCSTVSADTTCSISCLVILRMLYGAAVQRYFMTEETLNDRDEKNHRGVMKVDWEVDLEREFASLEPGNGLLYINAFLCR